MRQKQLVQLVLESKTDKQKMNDLLESYKPFIASCTQKLSGKYLEYGIDDELSVGMMAFVQAVKGYQPGNGNFMKYASVVIRNRVIDYYRSQNKHAGKVIGLVPNEGDIEDPLETRISMTNFSEEKTKQERLLEIQMLKEELARYEISLWELEKASPKNKQTRQICREVIHFLMGNPILLNETMYSKSLPLIQIEKILSIRRKKFERHRKYILAVLIIKSGDYPYLAEYVRSM